MSSRTRRQVCSSTKGVRRRRIPARILTDVVAMCMLCAGVWITGQIVSAIFVKLGVA